MTPKRKAKILLMDFSKVTTDIDVIKKCAIICANEMIRNYEKHPLARVGVYWWEVKKEIENYDMAKIIF